MPGCCPGRVDGAAAGRDRRSSSALGLAIGVWALRRLTPPGTLTARPVLPAAVLLRGILTCAFFGVDAFVALTLVGWRGLSATEAGIALTAATVAWTGRRVDPGPRRSSLADATASSRSASRSPSRAWPGCSSSCARRSRGRSGIAAFGVAGLGMGLAYSPLALIVLREAPAESQGAATSALSLTDSLGTALGTGITGAIVAASVR